MSGKSQAYPTMNKQIATHQAGCKYLARNFFYLKPLNNSVNFRTPDSVKVLKKGPFPCDLIQVANLEKVKLEQTDTDVKFKGRKALTKPRRPKTEPGDWDELVSIFSSSSETTESFDEEDSPRKFSRNSNLANRSDVPYFANLKYEQEAVNDVLNQLQMSSQLPFWNQPLVNPAFFPPHMFTMAQPQPIFTGFNKELATQKQAVQSRSKDVATSQSKGMELRRKNTRKRSYPVPRLTTGKKTKVQPRVIRDAEIAASTPKFMIEELKKVDGSGKFSPNEFLILLFCCYKYFMQPSTYSKVRCAMQYTRSRASIRRKVEKMTDQILKKEEMSLDKGGLLNTRQNRGRVRAILLSKLEYLIDIGFRHEERKEFCLKMQVETKKMLVETKDEI
eukprot:augustus_masked-scaffold_68-processed-gene-0.6-mRNA-1 protein AED:1.00 eAED:1.00 QI:0/0/0/0/1/1/2/0/389